MTTKTDDLRRQKLELERRRQQQTDATDRHYANVRRIRLGRGEYCSRPNREEPGTRAHIVMELFLKWCEDHPE
jgi:hypothetical protein